MQRLRGNKNKNEEPQLGPLTDEIRQQINNLNSVCLFLGPYRNLTTLTASVLFLHPQCQVLNHAGGRIYSQSELDFLADYSEEKFINFSHFALVMSQGGERGSYGGSIKLAHAFADHDVMSRVYEERYGNALVKDEVLSLVWKESNLTSNHLRQNNVDIDQLLAGNKKLRFLMPVRNPMDCARSNQRTGIKKYLGEFEEENELAAILERVMDEMAWVIALAQKHPSRFFYYFQNELSQDTLRDMAAFLDVAVDERWLSDAQKVMEITGGYEHSLAIIETYKKEIEKYFSDMPEIKTRFEAFLT
ncbi:MAG: hypothetical protein D8M60_01910 [Chloroflexi bacterium]|nr:hypothetical protein [Chloroflexota bacterium]